MAEHSFQKVMHQFDRMCKANSGCINCPLHQNDYYSDDECNIDAFVSHPEKIEQTVMQWAAENPVYPLWFEWLEKIGVAGRAYDLEPYFIGDKEILLRTAAFTPKAFEPIPADIAEKLGIEPKEG